MNEPIIKKEKLLCAIHNEGVTKFNDLKQICGNHEYLRVLIKDTENDLRTEMFDRVEYVVSKKTVHNHNEMFLILQLDFMKRYCKRFIPKPRSPDLYGMSSQGIVLVPTNKQVLLTTTALVWINAYRCTHGMPQYITLVKLCDDYGLTVRTSLFLTGSEEGLLTKGGRTFRTKFTTDDLW